jgi:hypothetical protein
MTTGRTGDILGVTDFWPVLHPDLTLWSWHFATERWMLSSGSLNLCNGFNEAKEWIWTPYSTHSKVNLNRLHI